MELGFYEKERQPLSLMSKDLEKVGNSSMQSHKTQPLEC
jgi:hypothetical protein